MGWIHRLIRPHCPECREEREAEKHCLSCETLRETLSHALWREKELMSKLFPIEIEPEKVVEQPIQPKTVPWRVKQQLLEEEDRERARNMRKTEELEREVLNSNIEMNSEIK